MATESDLKQGDRVSWNTSQGRTRGVVVKKLTSSYEIKGHHVAATKAEPQFLVRSEVSDEEAAHLPSALRKLKPKR